MKHKKKLIILIIIILLIITPIFIYYENNDIKVSKYIIENDKLANQFNDYTILQISDLHNKDFGDNNKKLINKIIDISPDMIVITGDLIDAYKTNINVALDFIKEIKHYAPIYYVNGNHEARMKNYEFLKSELKKLDVNVLENNKITITNEGASINLIGLCDVELGFSEDFLKNNIDNNAMNIVLSHRPELFSTYARYNCDLVLSGHAHGGQFRLPIIGGLVAPNQGFFPKYDAGLFIDGNTKMIVSRGLGNSIIPFRLFNKPELVHIKLKVVGR